MLAETVADLVNVFRNDVDDVDATPYLWSDTEVLSYLNEAVERLATDTNGLVKVLPINVRAGEPLVRLPQYVLQIYQARLQGAGTQLIQRNANDFGVLGNDRDYGHTGFSRGNNLFGQQGQPTAFVRDYDDGQLRLVPTPIVDDVLEIRCSVTQSFPLDMDDLLPFRKSADQRLLLCYMRFRAYNKHDAETEDLVRARKNESEYLGMVIDREQEIRNQRRTPGTVRMEY